MPPTQARLPIERGMLQRSRVRTAEFPLNVHVVNVAEPPLMYTTPPCDVRRYNPDPAIANASRCQRHHPEAMMQCKRNPPSLRPRP